MSDMAGLERLKGQQRKLEEDIVALHSEEWSADSDLKERHRTMQDRFVALGEQIDSLESFHAAQAAQSHADDTKTRSTSATASKPETLNQARRDATTEFYRGIGRGSLTEGYQAFAEEAQRGGIVNIGSTGTNSAAAVIQEVMTDQVIQLLRGSTAMRRESNEQTLDALGGDTGVRFLLNNDKSTAKVANELRSAGTANTTYDSLNAKGDRWTTQIVPIPNGVTADSHIDIVTHIGGLLAARMRQGQNKLMTIAGVNSDKVNNNDSINTIGAFQAPVTNTGGFGLDTTYKTHLEAAAAAAIVEADLRGLWALIHEDVVDDAVWMMNRATYVDLLSLAATNADDKRLVKRSGERNEDTIFGNRIAINSHVPGVATGNRPVGFGVLNRAYMIRDEGMGELVVYDGDSFKAMDAIGVEFKMRTAARPIDYYNYAVLTMA